MGWGQGAACDVDAACDGKNCTRYLDWGEDTKECMGPCCKDSDCGSGAYCDYFIDGTELIRQCMPSALIPWGSAPACCRDSDCGGGKCGVVVQDTWKKSTLTGLPSISPESRAAMRCM